MTPVQVNWNEKQFKSSAAVLKCYSAIIDHVVFLRSVLILKILSDAFVIFALIMVVHCSRSEVQCWG